MDTFGLISSSKKARKSTFSSNLAPNETRKTTFFNNLAPIECIRCCKPCKDTELLAEHVKSHDDDSKPFGCYICKKQFHHKPNLRAHIRRVSILIAPDSRCIHFFCISFQSESSQIHLYS